MKILQINTSCGVGSTGKIAVSISQLLVSKEIENEILYSSTSSGYQHGIKCGKKNLVKLEALKSRILGNYGFNSISETKKIIAEVERFAPDVILLHNIHGHDCNLSLLFSYFKQNHNKLYWTFHDCWAFTGYCTYFTMDKCDKWITGCCKCPQYRLFSWFFDRSSKLYQRKKKLFTGLDLTIITPSQWLADLVKKSFLNRYPIKVINNGIDLSVFKPKTNEFRKRYGISDETFMLLGVAFGWGKRKGLDVFIELSKRLDEKQFKIVLVGTDDMVDKLLPENIISIHRTQDQNELAEIYSASDLFVNPTREENYPTVNMEAIACGTPVITFNTGGSPEILDEKTGVVVEYDNIDEMERQIIRICTEKVFKKEDCLKRAHYFDKNLRFNEYAELLIGELK